MQANQQALEDQLRQFAGQRIAENMSERPQDEGIDSLLNRPFSALSDRDMERLRKEVQRLATALKTRVALRQKRAKTGQLDAKATIRANLKHGNVPIEIKHRERSLKPKLVVICDVSTSMRYCSELMLSLLYHMQDLISKTHAFAFINRLEYISPDFTEREVHTRGSPGVGAHAVRLLQHRPGQQPGRFPARTTWELIDGRTTFIIVGDGRNNYNDPRLDIFNTVARRSRRTIWINPEAPGPVGQRRQRYVEIRAELRRDLASQHAGAAHGGGGPAAGLRAR